MKPFAVSVLLLTLGTALFSQRAPYPPSTLVKGIAFDWSSHIRLASGSDNWPVTWADDDHQYTVWGDGGGFGGTNSVGRSSLGVARIEGPWHDPDPVNIWGGYKGEHSHNQIGKSYGIICINSTLYMCVGMLENRPDPFREIKIARSDDHGASWTFTDWSFTRAEGVMMPTICNFGRDYQGARDDFVYFYLLRFQSDEGPDDYEDKVSWLNCQKPGIIDLARVPKDRVMDRSAYTFFAGMNNQIAVWSGDISQRIPVFENQAGVGWCMSAIYNAGLDCYLIVTEHTETHRGNIGIFEAPDPWGPWSTVLYEQGWGDGHFPVNTFYWNFSNKWTSADGIHFSMIFSGRKENDSFNLIRGRFQMAE